MLGINITFFYVSDLLERNHSDTSLISAILGLKGIITIFASGGIQGTWASH